MSNKKLHILEGFVNRTVQPLGTFVVGELNKPHRNFSQTNEVDGRARGSLKETDPFCLCQEVKWIWRLSQAMGLNPLTIKCKGKGQESVNKLRPKLDLTNAVKCKLVRSKCSVSYVNSVGTLLFFIVITCLTSKTVGPVVSAMFKGTDAYVFKLHFAFRVVQTLSVIICGFLYNRHLILGWESVQQVTRVLNHKFPSCVRRTSKILAVVATLMGTINLLYTVCVGIRICYFDGDSMSPIGNGQGDLGLGRFQHTCSEFGMFYYILFVWTLSSSEFAHLIMSSFLFVIALVMKCLQKGLASLLQQALENSLDGTRRKDLNGLTFVYTDVEYTDDNDLSVEIERLRLVYEQLCETVVHLRKFFGVSCLIICCDGILTCVFGFYWRIIYTENLSGEDGHSTDIYHYILFSMHMTYSVCSICLILISGHYLVTSGLESPSVIRKSKLSHLSSSARFQVSLLLQTSSGFPIRFSVYSITNLEMPFLAAATTNVITYLLVLMQFRMEQTNQKT